MLSRLRRPPLRSPYSRSDLRADALAGLTVGVIALPLSMALAIAAGVPPQHGLYTAIIGGAVIALTGGSRVNISGPTAAFVVILLPITSQYGIGGLLLSGLMAGLILIAMGAAGLGSLIRLVPYPVTVGFTAGIAVVIATLQLRDFLGLQTADAGHSYVDTVLAIASGLPSARWPELLTGAITLTVLVAWQRRRSRVPAHLVALLAGTLAALALGRLLPESNVATIGSRFSFVVDGLSGQGIPPIPPRWAWPWQLPDATGVPIGVTMELVRSLLGSAFAIAMLGALESLLCATVADGMTGTRHDPNRELIGQGIGNLLVPFFGGIPATAALARTAANVRAGARSPVAGMVHSAFLLAALLALAPVLAWVPMASMAALLLVVAWNMSEARHFRRILRVAPRGDIATLLSCFGLTVLVNMEVAVAVGMGLAALLFIRRTIELTGTRLMSRKDHPHTASLPDSVVLYDVNGPLFFGAAQKALDGLTRLHGEIRVVILDMSDVTMIDMTAIVAMESIIDNLRVRGIGLVICGLEPRIILKLRRAGVRKRSGITEFARNIEEASQIAAQRIAPASAPTIS